MQNNFNYSVAIDIGGTFTDAVLQCANNQLISVKSPTTPSDPTQGAINALEAVLSQANVSISQVSQFFHGTTLATNTLIERTGSKVCLITTQGFRDILEIAYERRYSQYDLTIEKPDLIVPRSRCITVKQRMNVEGEILVDLNSDSINQLLGEIERLNVESLAICLLHSYVNPVHEKQLRAAIVEHFPKLYISLSSEISPEAREFERACTSVANAYIQPLMSGYLSQFETQLKLKGLNCPILMITSGAGMTTIDTAKKMPIRLVESGPSGGAIMAATCARQKSFKNVLSFDMGGTTAKLCLIDNFTPKTSRKFEINRAERFIKGSGMPVRIPVVDMIEIGAGGGSYAAIDSLGRLTVGPQSAGAEPGPCAFGRGGDRPTVTDADVSLGYINASLLENSFLTIASDKAESAIERVIAKPLSIETKQASYYINQIVDENMANAGRMHSVESGVDISNYSMIAFGGNGPLHATKLARKLGITQIVIPKDPGVGSAVGFLNAPVSFEIVRSHYTLLSSIDINAINKLISEMLDDAKSIVKLGAPNAQLQCTRTAFMRYHGQGHEIEIALENRDLKDSDKIKLVDSFEKAYASQFSRAVPKMQIEILNWSVNVFVKSKGSDIEKQAVNSRTLSTNETREIVCDVSEQLIDASIYHRDKLMPGDQIDGPALIVEPQSTTLVSRDFNAHIDDYGNLLLNKTEGK